MSNEITASELSFCDKLQAITYQTANQYCGTPLWPSPKEPIDSGPMVTETLTAVFEVPNDTTSNKQQVIYVGIGYGFTNPTNPINPSNPIKIAALTTANITSILNVAYDVNDSELLQLLPELNATKKTVEITEKDGKIKNESVLIYTRQLAKVGLIDGPGNTMMTLVAAVYMAEQLLFFPSEEEQIYEYGMTNIYPKGNLLIHCHSGGSRSVTITALYIYYRFYATQEGNTVTFEEIYKQIVCYRSKGGAPNGHPTMGICTTAFEVLNTFSQLFPEPVFKQER
ncbi:hypothetical protein [Dokdonia sp.]|uniref:hypothetical protein n=1 Tax=Dokdonia sp. TaxID=2024995 RepID=UPI003264FEDA